MNRSTGERIRSRREELGFTQDELAKKIGFKSRSSINKIEVSREVPLKKVKLLADALETTVPYLMGWEVNGSLDSNAGEYLAKFKRLKESEQKLVYSLIDTLLDARK